MPRAYAEYVWKTSASRRKKTLRPCSSIAIECHRNEEELRASLIQLTMIKWPIRYMNQRVPLPKLVSVF